MRRRRWLRWIGVACLVPILLVLVVLLSAPLWINEGLVKREVTQIISSATGGKAQFERIDLHYFPFPGVVISGLRFSLPGTLELQAQSASVDIRVLPLLFSAARMATIRMLASPMTPVTRSGGMIHSFWTQHMTVLRSTPRSFAK